MMSYPQFAKHCRDNFNTPFVTPVFDRRNVYSNNGFALGGGQSKMPDDDDNILVSLFCLTATMIVLINLAYYLFK